MRSASIVIRQRASTKARKTTYDVRLRKTNKQNAPQLGIPTRKV